MSQSIKCTKLIVLKIKRLLSFGQTYICILLVVMKEVVQYYTTNIQHFYNVIYLILFFIKIKALTGQLVVICDVYQD